MPKIIYALLIKVVALVLLAGGVYGLSFWVAPPYADWALVLSQATLASLFSAVLRWPKWWWLIQFVFPIGIYLGVQSGFNPLLALVVFALVWLVFSNAFKERVPLYLTNDTTRQALKALVKRQRDVRFLDLGCGLGGNVAFMSQLRGVSVSHGVETAPVPYLMSRLWTVLRGGQVFAMDLWKTDLAYYDLVYAFLSPEPMPRLWEKVKEEMLPGSVFVSNSFAIPNAEPSEIWELSDARRTKLFIYRL